MMAKEVKVFGAWFSPFSRRVELALKLKGVQYEYIEEDLANKSPLLLKYNPVHKKIPVLLHKEKAITESLVILEYIDETWKGHNILPEDPYQRAMARFWAKFLDEKCLPALWKAYWYCDGKEQEKALEEISEHLKTLENELKGKKFFGGDTIGFVDIAATFICSGVVLQEVAGVTLFGAGKFPLLDRWIEDSLACDVVKETLPSREKLYAFFAARSEAIRSAKSMVYK